MVLENYVTDKGQPLKFSDERSRCLGEIQIGFDRAFGASSTWEVDYCWVPHTFGNFQTVVCDRTRTETDGGTIADTFVRCFELDDHSNKSDLNKR
jgi:hypothetical protein